MGSRDSNKSPNMRIGTALPILLLTGLDSLLLALLVQVLIKSLSLTLVLAQAGTWLLAHCILHSAQVNRVENGLNGA